MGSASCKNPKSTEQDRKKEDSKKITIGVFGLSNAGKTSAVKAIEGAPTNDVAPTMASQTTNVPRPTAGKGDSKSQERITIIDLSGAERFRQKSWPDYYKKIHGLIFVIDASEKKRLPENQKTLQNLLDHDDLKDKPMLILANKQDERGAINKEDRLKDKLQIEELQRKHKIEFCTAIPDENNKADVSIRQGFSWLIRTIDNDYTKINARVADEKSSHPPKPMERKFQTNTKRKGSDDSDDDDIQYSHHRAGSPSPNKKTVDYRGTTTSTKVPNLDLSKVQKKRSGYATHSASDDDEERDTLSRLRPNIAHSKSDTKPRDHSSNLPALSAMGGLNQKKKPLGSTGMTSDLSTKKSNDNEPKSFRSAYEPFPEESPWSTGLKKPNKYDELTSRSFNKPTVTNDLNKRIASPLVRDTKPFGTNTIQKRANVSDDDDDDGFNSKPKPKSTIPTTSKSPSTVKKPLYGMDDEYDLKGSSSSNLNRRLNLTAPIITKKSYHDDDDDDDDRLKKTTTKSTKGFDSDEENKKKPTVGKPYQPSIDRYNPLSDYRGTTSKPPSSPVPKTFQSKIDDDDRPSSLSKTNLQNKRSDDDYPSSLSKTLTRPKFGEDNRSTSPYQFNTRSKLGDEDRSATSTKPIARTRFDDDHDAPSISKPSARFNYPMSDRPGSAMKPTTFSKRVDDDDDYGAKSKPSTKSKFDNDDDDYKSTTRPNYKDTNRSSSPAKPSTKSKYDDDDDDDYKPSTRSYNKDNDRSSPAKPSTKSKFDDDDDDYYKPSTHSTYKDTNRSSSPAKPSTKSKFDDDDDDYKPSTHSTYKDTNRSSSPAKSNTKSKFDDDDDDYYKPSTRSNHKDNDRSSSTTKPATRSKFDDDDDDYKPTTRSNYKDNDHSSSSSKPNTRSKFEEDDDDDYKPSTHSNYRSSSPAKPSSHSKYDDDDDDDRFSAVKKPVTRSKFEDDDDYSGIGGARSRYGKDDYDSSKNGRTGSAITGRYQSNYKTDT